MLVCLNRWLKTQNIHLTVIADQAPKVIEQHHLSAIQNYPFLGQFAWVDSLLRGKALLTLKALLRCDVVLCGGGDVIRDSIGWRTFSFQVEKLVVALLFHKPLYLLNVGLSQPVTRLGRATLKWLLPRCRGIVVRDARSVQICRQFAAGGQVRLLPDIVRRLSDLFPSASPTHSLAKTSILLALHGDSNVYDQYELTPIRIETLAAILDSMVEHYGLEIEFFPFQPHDDGGDALIARQVQNSMRHSGKARILEWTLDLSEIAARYSRSRLVVAMRLHAAVLAAAYSIPCVLMPYDQKVVEFGEQAKIPYLLTPELLDKRVMAMEMLHKAMSEQIAPEPLPPAQDWMQFTLRSLSKN